MMTQTTTDESTLSADEIHDLLGNPRRRRALRVMKSDESMQELSSIAEEVAALENGKPRSDLTSRERHLVYTSIQQNHIPRLERAGVITHEQGEIELTSKAERLDNYMDTSSKTLIQMSESYIYLSTASFALIGVVWVDAPPELVPSLAWVVLIHVVFAILVGWFGFSGRDVLFKSGDRLRDCLP